MSALRNLLRKGETMSDNLRRWLERIQIAMLANGGEEWQQRHCSCDPSVGISPCQYCAIHEALLFTKDQLLMWADQPSPSKVCCSPVTHNPQEDATYAKIEADMDAGETTKRKYPPFENTER